MNTTSFSPPSCGPRAAGGGGWSPAAREGRHERAGIPDSLLGDGAAGGGGNRAAAPTGRRRRSRSSAVGADYRGLDVLAVRQARLVQLVREGQAVAEAAGMVFVAVGTVQKWREKSPAFRERLDQAKRDARIMRRRRLQHEFLARVERGQSMADALRELGLGPAQATNWLRQGRRRRDVWFEREWRRVRGPTGRIGDRFTRLLDELRRGASMKEACQAVRLDGATPYRWKRSRPDLWQAVEAARAEGRIRRAA